MHSARCRTHWLQECPLSDSLTILTGLARTHAELAGRFSGALLALLDAGDFAGLCAFEIDYRDDDQILDLINARQCLGFFSKLEPLDIGLDKEAVALGNFIRSEEQCTETNLRLREARRVNFSTVDLSLRRVLDAASRKIWRLLGPVPSYEQLHFAFGPGANTTVKASASSPRHKLGARLACSSELASSVGVLLAEAPAWASAHAFEDNDDSWFVNVEIDYGKLQFVPKNAKMYRSIVVEPVLNSFAQKGVGSYLRGRLRRSGVNLDDQSRNQTLARVGSIADNLATLDLSMASDTVSLETVAELFPPEWYSFLSRFRTGTVVYQSQKFPLQKFSSMGNAFTFELETILFWALSVGVCDVLQLPVDEVSVYGDDIIVPSAAYDLLAATLGFLGFSVNSQKSFKAGPFRESCGSDWFKGFDIRPYYQKTLVSGETLFTLHNFYMRRLEFEMARAVESMIPESLRIYGPDRYGDGHLIGSYVGRRTPRMKRRGWEGVIFDTYARKKRRLVGLVPGDAVLPVYSIYASPSDEHPADHFVVRGSRGYRRMSIYILTSGVFR